MFNQPHPPKKKNWQFFVKFQKIHQCNASSTFTVDGWLQKGPFLSSVSHPKLGGRSWNLRNIIFGHKLAKDIPISPQNSFYTKKNVCWPIEKFPLIFVVYRRVYITIIYKVSEVHVPFFGEVAIDEPRKGLEITPFSTYFCDVFFFSGDMNLAKHETKDLLGCCFFCEVSVWMIFAFHPPVYMNWIWHRCHWNNCPGVPPCRLSWSRNILTCQIRH